MKKALKWCFAAALTAALVAASLWVWELTGAYQGYTSSLTVEIEPGTRTAAVAHLLADRGVVHYPSAFLMLATLGRLAGRSLKAGEYLFDGPLSPLAVYRKIVHGDVYLHTVVIPEGSDRFEIARIVQERLRIDPDDFVRATLRTELIQDLDPKAPSLEGYLFPDSYRFPRGTSAASVVARMLSRFRQVMCTKLPPELSESPDRLHEVMTLASLVEKETPQPEERPRVAGVFLRRLANGIPLQCDPTVVYAVRQADTPAVASWEKTIAITRSDLEIDSPFNTYQHAGLPPGPICSPGVASIEAALNAAPGDALYFVSNNHGGHVFAATLAQHQRNVTRYRRKLEEERRAARAANGSGNNSAAHLAMTDPPGRAPFTRKAAESLGPSQSKGPQSGKGEKAGSHAGPKGGRSAGRRPANRSPQQ